MSRRRSIIKYSSNDKERMLLENKKRGDVRTDFEIDRDRIIHSSAFRRLQAKTQVYGAGLMDFYRTRLTHSIEVSQIAKSIGLRLGVDTDLLEAISLAHDIGHPPFGHTGEWVLNSLCLDGFEANAHNIVVLMFLETKIIGKDLSENRGLNLTRATLDGLLKYKTTRNKNNYKFLYDYEFFRKLIEWIDPSWDDDRDVRDKRSLECQIVNWADNSAYSVHDLEDGIKSGLLKSYLLNDSLFEKVKEYFKRKGNNFSDDSIIRTFRWVKNIVRYIESANTEVERKRRLKYITSRLINDFVLGVSLQKVDDKQSRYSYKLVYKKTALLKSEMLRSIENLIIYRSKNILRTRKKCEMIIKKLYEVFYDVNARDLYPREYQEYWDFFDARNSDEWRSRLACWYIAGMTDNFAIKTYKEFFDPDTLVDIFISV